MNRILALAAATLLAAAPAFAQAPSAPPAASPKTYDMRDDAGSWISDPNVHAFYEMTVEAFAQGPNHLDREAYRRRSREIITALALSQHMNPAALQDHLKAIPDEIIAWATRDPHTLDSYDSFVVALFGPQRQGPGAR